VGVWIETVSWGNQREKLRSSLARGRGLKQR